MSNRKVPFDTRGNMMGYDGYSWEVGEYKDMDTLFEATLKYKDYSRGRSSIKLIFVDVETNIEYEMFISEFDRLMKLKAFEGDTITGGFSFHKKGANFGVYFIPKK